MSIIIKGLNLPSVSDTNGIINLSIDCYGQVIISNTYPTKILKAEQLPQHGRLGDLDKLENGLRLMAKYQHGERQQGILGCCATIRMASTIIEAEDEE